MASISIQPVRPHHVLHVAATMRTADAAEVRASLDMAPLEALVYSREQSEVTVAILLNGEAAALAGMGPLPDFPDAGLAWILTGTAVDSCPVAYFKACRQVLAGFLDRKPRLCNLVDARYAKAVAWVRRLGFEVLPAEAYGPHGVPFCLVTIGR